MGWAKEGNSRAGVLSELSALGSEEEEEEERRGRGEGRGGQLLGKRVGSGS